MVTARCMFTRMADLQCYKISHVYSDRLCLVVEALYLDRLLLISEPGYIFHYTL
jgi:hypothetical protein